MSYEYGSESKLLELPNPYQLQNRLLWLCAALLVVAGVVSLLWAKAAIEQSALRAGRARRSWPASSSSPPGWSPAATAATRLRFFFGRGRPASLAPEIPAGASGGSPAATAVKEILRQGGLTYPEPQGAVEGVLYHWAPTLDHRAARGAVAGAALHVQPGGDRGDAAQLRLLVVRVRQRGDAALDRHPLFHLRRRLPDPAAALAAQGAA